MIGSDVVDVSVDYGTGIISHRYYHTEKDLLSKEFYYVATCNGRLVAYLDGKFDARILIVEDLFDETIRYEFSNLNFSSDVFPVLEAAFSEDGTLLSIEYYCGNTGGCMEKELIIK